MHHEHDHHDQEGSTIQRPRGHRHPVERRKKPGPNPGRRPLGRGQVGNPQGRPPFAGGPQQPVIDRRFRRRRNQRQNGYVLNHHLFQLPSSV